MASRFAVKTISDCTVCANCEGKLSQMRKKNTVQQNIEQNVYAGYLILSVASHK